MVNDGRAVRECILGKYISIKQKELRDYAYDVHQQSKLRSQRCAITGLAGLTKLERKET